MLMYESLKKTCILVIIAFVFFSSFQVSGDANFSIQRTGMTIGGFIQPSVARALIEQQSNVEKGLCQRFLWIVPKPTIVTQLQQVDARFVSVIGKYS